MAGTGFNLTTASKQQQVSDAKINNAYQILTFDNRQRYYTQNVF
jgi:hypothetical protein